MSAFARLSDRSTALGLGDAADRRLVVVFDVLDAFAWHDAAAARSIRDALPGQGRGSWRPIIDGWDDLAPAFATLETWASQADVPTTGVDAAPLAPPLADPELAVFAIGANFAQHAAQASTRGAATKEELVARAQALIDGKRDGVPPWGFTILARTIVGHGNRVGLPPDLQCFDYEGEVGAVLRVGVDGISIWGVTPWNDLSIRGHHLKRGPRVDEGPLTWSLQKNFDNGSVCGPCVVVDPALDPQQLHIATRVNGEQRQDGSTSEMVYSYREVIDHLSQFVTLRSGDIIVSGTPAGTAIEQGLDGPFLMPGDEVEIEIGGLGVLRNPVGKG
jgi:2-keto-4-pentenoate hydratase/2-oxohepta-3-ene-1,7-dioic acid hydratase in catechol pathway